VPRIPELTADGANKFMHPQKPFAGTRLNVVNSIASDVLLHLRQEELIIFDQHLKAGNASACWRKWLDAISEAVPASWITTWLRDTLSSSAWLDPKVPSLPIMPVSIAPPPFSSTTQDDPGMRKIDFLNLLMRLGQNLLSL
jgi:hypothetical protein